MKPTKCSAGFTFVEIIVSIVILGIVGSMAFIFIGDTTEIYGITTAQARLNDQLWVSMERISRELQYVDQVNITYPPDPTATSDTITFNDASKALCDGSVANPCIDDSQTISYWWDNDIASATY